MSKKVIISIDVEAQTPRSPNRHVERLIYGRIKPETPAYGINRMFEIADKYGIQLTCFFDYGEISLYGEKWLNVARFIQARGHDLELHIHPDYIPQNLWPEGLARELNMFNLDAERADFLADYICKAHRSLTGEDAIAFRGGGYRYNGFLLQALARNGVKFDSSYNAARAQQIFNQGPLPPFEWDCGMIEIPIPCLPSFRGSSGLVEFNFNNYDFQNHFPRVCVGYMGDYLQEYFRRFPDGIPVLVMHSWSFLKLNNDSGFFDEINPRAPEIFDGFCKLLAEQYEPLSFAQLGKSAWQPKISREYEPNIFSMPVGADAGAYKCPVCGAGAEELKENCGIEKRLCAACGAVERTRTLARLLLEEHGINALSGKKVLHLGGKGSENRIVQAIGDVDAANLDIRPEVKPDVVADICKMPQVAGKSFDAIIATQFLSHVYDLPAALSELARTLKDDGILIQNDDASPKALTREVSDPAEITAYCGKEIFEKYRIGRFRIFGEYDIDEIFAPWFVRVKYEVEDPATGKTEIWNCWKKRDPRDATAREEIAFELEQGGQCAPSLAGNECLFFENQIVEPGKKAKLYGLLDKDAISDVAITDAMGKTVATLKATGSLSQGARKRLCGNATVEYGVPASLGEVEIPAWLKPGLYFFDKRWLFFVSAPLEEARALVALPIATMQMFSDFGGHSRYSEIVEKMWEYSCSLARPLSRFVLEHEVCIRADFFAWLTGCLNGKIAFAADHDLPDLAAEKLPKLIIVPGRSEYWTSEAAEILSQLLEQSHNVIFAASEIMYCKLRRCGDRVTLDKKDAYRDGSIRAVVGCNCFDGGFISSEMYRNDIGYGDFTVLDDSADIFKATGLKNGDIIDLRTLGYEGLPVLAYNEAGTPQVDRAGLSAWKQVDVAAFSMGQKGPDKKIGALAYFDAGKGGVLNLGGMTWVSSDIFESEKAHPALKIWENALDFCLSDSATPFICAPKETVASNLPDEKILALATCPICGNELKEFENQQNCPGCASRARPLALPAARRGSFALGHCQSLA